MWFKKLIVDGVYKLSEFFLGLDGFCMKHGWYKLGHKFYRLSKSLFNHTIYLCERWEIK